MDAADLTPDLLGKMLTEHGRSQAALARYIGKDTSAVNRMVKGERQIKFAEMGKILRYLRETDPAWDSSANRLFRPDGKAPSTNDILGSMSHISHGLLTSFATCAAATIALMTQDRVGVSKALGDGFVLFPQVAAWAARGADLITDEDVENVLALMSFETPQKVGRELQDQLRLTQKVNEATTRLLEKGLEITDRLREEEEAAEVTREA